MHLDKLDIGIVTLLREDGRVTVRQLASSLETTETTVKKRLTRLLNNQILTVTAFVEPAKFGYMQEAVLNLRVRIGHVEAAAKTLSSFQEVRFVAITTGPYDIVCTAVLPQTHDLLRFTSTWVSQIEGIVSVDTALSLKILKRASEWVPAVLQDQ